MKIKFETTLVTGTIGEHYKFGIIQRKMNCNSHFSGVGYFRPSIYIKISDYVYSPISSFIDFFIKDIITNKIREKYEDKI